MADELPFNYPDAAGPSYTGAVGRRCGRHTWVRSAEVRSGGVVVQPAGAMCVRCAAVRDETKARRGKSSARLGKDGERRSERRYGWEKIGERGEITDLRGRLFKVQQKTTRAAAPATWRAIFAALDASKDGRVGLVLHSYVRAGVATEDYIVIRGTDWLDLHGKDAA